MSITINVADWKPMLDCAKAYISEAVIRVGGGHATIMEVDDTKTNMIHIAVDCEGEGEFAVDLEKFSKALAAAGQDPILDIEEGYLRIEGTAKVKVPIIIKESNIKWPEKFYDKEKKAECNIAPSQMDPVLSYGQFCNQALVRFVIGDTRMIVKVGEEPDMSEITSLSTATGESEVVFSLPMIQAVIKVAKGVDAVTVKGFGNNFPMVFSWVNGTGNYNILIAPHIDEDM